MHKEQGGPHTPDPRIPGPYTLHTRQAAKVPEWSLSTQGWPWPCVLHWPLASSSLANGSQKEALPTAVATQEWSPELPIGPQPALLLDSLKCVSHFDEEQEEDLGEASERIKLLFSNC